MNFYPSTINACEGRPNQTTDKTSALISLQGQVSNVCNREIRDFKSEMEKVFPVSRKQSNPPQQWTIVFLHATFWQSCISSYTLLATCLSFFYVYLPFFYTKQFMQLPTTKQKPVDILDNKLFFPLHVYTMLKIDQSPDC